jgi:alcohol dehydrogenase class IV
MKEIPKGIVSFSLSDWGVKKNEIDLIAPECFAKGRMENNIVPLNYDDVIKILLQVF